jgi:hypothetical protein
VTGDDGWRLVFDGRFDAGDGTLDRSRWLPWYLPHWSSRSAAAARYRIVAGALHLRIDDDQLPWCPEFDGELRVSSVQTAEFAGPLGSRVGQHPVQPGCIVREEQADERPYAPSSGRVELRARAVADPRMMVALWMIGLGDAPGRGGEVCVAEIFGRSVGPEGADVGMGIHAFDDATLVEDFATVHVRFDVTEAHAYQATWGGGGAEFAIDGVIVRRCATAPTYPLALMLGIYRFPRGPDDPPDAAPTPSPTFIVERVRGYVPSG